MALTTEQERMSEILTEGLTRVAKSLMDTAETGILKEVGLIKNQVRDMFSKNRRGYMKEEAILDMLDDVERVVRRTCDSVRKGVKEFEAEK